MIHTAHFHHALLGRLLRSAAAFGLIASLAVAVPVSAADESLTEADPPAVIEDPAIGILEGEAIDLAADWGEARACAVTDTGVICFRSVAELDAHERAVAARSGRSLSCSTPLRLYSGQFRTGRVLSISERGRWVNLSSYGFDNQTSSYRAGSCRILLAAGSFGAGSQHPGCRRAYCTENVMRRGWNNVVSSVYNR